MIRSRKRLSPAAVLIIFCSVAYFMNYLTRYNLTASMEYMADALAPSLNGYADALAEARNRLGGALLANSVAYGIGQVVCGFLGDRIPPRYFMFFGLCGTAACNLAVFLIRDISAGVSLIVLLWCLNGIFQSCVWPPIPALWVPSPSIFC
ncbi:MAG: MFS transporter [Clostridia bacterium]|nr:MFS transporter [Clostridia bacterium]